MRLLVVEDRMVAYTSTCLYQIHCDSENHSIYFYFYVINNLEQIELKPANQWQIQKCA